MSKNDETAASAASGADDELAAKRVRQELIARRAAERDLRLKAQLRANLQRRKVQTRARREGEADERPGDLAARPNDG
jgi:hypothetical protein